MGRNEQGAAEQPRFQVDSTIFSKMFSGPDPNLKNPHEFEGSNKGKCSSPGVRDGGGWEGVAAPPGSTSATPLNRRPPPHLPHARGRSRGRSRSPRDQRSVSWGFLRIRSGLDPIPSVWRLWRFGGQPPLRPFGVFGALAANPPLRSGLASVALWRPILRSAPGRAGVLAVQPRHLTRVAPRLISSAST